MSVHERAECVLAQRQARGMSQADLVRALKTAGLTTTQSEISRIELGRRKELRPDVAEALGKVLGLAVEQLGPIAVLDGSTTHQGPLARKASKGRRKPKPKAEQMPSGWERKTTRESDLPKPAPDSALTVGWFPTLTEQQITAARHLLERLAPDLVEMVLPEPESEAAA